MQKNHRSRILLTLIVASFMGSVCLAAEIEVTVSTDKTVYDYLEPISVSVTATNPNDYTVTLEWPTSGQAAYIMDDTYDHRAYIGVLPVFTYRDIAAHESYTWTYDHLFDYYTPGVGEHFVTGVVIYDGINDGDQSDPFSFEVVPEPGTLSLLAIGGLAMLRRRK